MKRRFRVIWKIMAYATYAVDRLRYNRYRITYLLALVTCSVVLLYFKYSSIPQILYATPIDVLGSFLPVEPERHVLVTGGAGFVGFHLAKMLANKERTEVIVMDNFNDYYDVRLKIDRAYELHKAGIDVYNEDVCNEDFLAELFVKHGITHVAHLAAQAGVRYSLENPLAYVKANVQCQLALLNAIRDHPQEIKLVYASSSSVYGKESEIPFRLSAPTDKPGNMYAATKKTDELLGLHYCQAHHIRAVGLRFFTVYGEWGRPDMSVYKFADAIMSDREVPMFFVSDDDPLGRDFTYIDDVVSGILAAMEYEPKKCGERFNLGFGHPVSVPEMIEILQEELKIKGKVQKLPLPPTEILRTWADIRTSTELLGFKPRTNLTMGLRAFVKWFKPYREMRAAEEGSDELSPSMQWFVSLTEENLQRQKEYEEGREERENDRMLARYVLETEKYKHEHYKKVVYRQMGGESISPYSDLGTLQEFNGDVQALQRHCAQLEDCAAFTLSGTLKSAVLPRSQWSKEGEVMFVPQGDLCKTRFHVCHKRANCVHDEHELYRCECLPNYSGDGVTCLPIHGAVATQDIEQDHWLMYHHVYNASHMKSRAQWLQYAGKDSTLGDYMIVPGQQSVQNLKEICASQPICIGFTTKGKLKMRIDSPDMWIDDDHAHSLYIYDLNYCVWNKETCPEYSECRHLGRGDSRCTCSDGYVMFYGTCVKAYPTPSLIPSLAQCSATTS